MFGVKKKKKPQKPPTYLYEQLPSHHPKSRCHHPTHGNYQLQVRTALRKYTSGNLLLQDGIQDMISHAIKSRTIKAANYTA